MQLREHAPLLSGTQSKAISTKGKTAFMLSLCCCGHLWCPRRAPQKCTGRSCTQHPKSRLTLCLLVLPLSAFGWRAYEQSNNQKPTEGRRDFKNLQSWLDNCTSPLLCPSNPRGWCGPQAAHGTGLMKAKESWWGGMLKRLRTSNEVCAPALECTDLSRNPGSVL